MKLKREKKIRKRNNRGNKGKENKKEGNINRNRELGKR